MKKSEFIDKLQKGLNGLPQTDIDRSVEFYSEIIEDKIEEGLTEEEAVAQIGSVESTVLQILSEIPLAKLVKDKIKPKRPLKIWEIVLLVLGSPIWLSLLIAAFVVVLSVYIVMWTLIISLWAVFAALLGCALGGIAAGIIFIFNGHALTGVAMIGAGIVCAGFSIFLFYGCKASTKGILWLTKKMALGIKNCFIKKEEA